MAIEEQLNQDAPQPQEAPQQMDRLSEDEEKDLKIAVLLTERLLEDGGYDVIEKAVNTSKDPSQVIGQFLLQLIKKLDESMPNQAKLSKRIWLCKGGWLEQIMDQIIEEFGLDYAIADKAEVYVAHTAQQLAKAGNAEGGAAPQPQDAANLAQQAEATLPQPGGV